MTIATLRAARDGLSDDRQSLLRLILPKHPLQWAARALAIYVAAGLLGMVATYGVAIMPNSPLRRIYEKPAFHNPVIFLRSVTPADFQPINEGVPTSWNYQADPNGGAAFTGRLVKNGSKDTITTTNWDPGWYLDPSKNTSDSSIHWLKSSPLKFRLMDKVGEAVYGKSGVYIGELLKVESEATSVKDLNWAVLDIIQPDNTIVRMFSRGPKLSYGRDEKQSQVLLLDDR